MKEYNTHTHLEAYRKLMEIFPIGIIVVYKKPDKKNCVEQFC